MKFEQYQQIKAHALAACTAAGLTYGEPKQLNPILLAYIGDVVFSLYVRLRLLPTSGQVRVIHDLSLIHIFLQDLCFYINFLPGSNLPAL